MAKLGISTGTTPNDDTGDSLLDGAVKVNSNFDELYNLLGDGTTLSVGVVTAITAGSGINVSGTGNITITNTGTSTTNINADTLNVSGVSTFVGIVTNQSTIFGTQLSVSGVSTLAAGVSISSGNVHLEESTGATNNRLQFDTDSYIYKSGSYLNLDSTNTRMNAGSFTLRDNLTSLTYLGAYSGRVELFYNGSEKLQTTNSGVDVTGNLTATGVVDATSFSGSGNVSTNTLVVSGVSTVGVVTGATYYGNASYITHSKWDLGADGSTHYLFTGPAGLSSTADPVIYLARGQNYEFVNNMGAHPFEIRSSNGGSAFSTGVTNNAVSNGTLRFEVPFSAPNSLYYQCTSHAGMGGTIVIYPNQFTV